MVMLRKIIDLVELLVGMIGVVILLVSAVYFTNDCRFVCLIAAVECFYLVIKKYPIIIKYCK